MWAGQAIGGITSSTAESPQPTRWIVATPWPILTPEEQEEQRQREEELRRRQEEEARQKAEEEAARLQALKDSGIPYVGMAENEVNATAQMGQAYRSEEETVYGWDGDGERTVEVYQSYAWYEKDSGNLLLKVKCQDGVVVAVEKRGGSDWWDGDKLLACLGEQKIETFHYGGSTDRGPYNVKDYYSAEDFYEDHRDDFSGLDEAEAFYDDHIND